MRAAHLVGVGDDDDLLALEERVEVRLPILAAAAVGGCDEIEPPHGFHVLLALDDEHLARLDDGGEVVEHAPHAVQVLGGR